MYNINNEHLSWVAFISFLLCSIYVKYVINPMQLYKILEVWNFMCENNPTILDYLEIKPLLETVIENHSDNDTKTNNKDEFKLETKYENTYHEKYLQKFRTFPNNCNFTEEEQKELATLKVSLKANLIEKYNNELKETNDKLNDIQLIIAAGGLNTHEGICLLLNYFNLEEEYNEDPDDVDLDECWTDLLIDKGTKEIKLTELKQQTETYDRTDEEIETDAYNTVLKKHLMKHMDNYILECTPLGNVYMRYNSTKETFEYFSDSTLPYRYLETVARKYVMTYWCKPIFVDVEDELKRATDNKKEVKQAVKPTKETLEIMNKIKARGVNMSLPPQVQANLSSIQNGVNNDKHLLKERSNRYTWEGRLHDFCPLKKIDKKVINKRLNLSFSEFKKMMNQNKK
jgi:hypothetical protein